MNSKALMFQGTGSDVGKSTIVAGLCRLAKRRGISVAPFKPQNMSNNAAACADGGEIGRAQALQARACGLALHTDFNPVLLKPQSDRSAQVVVQGEVLKTVQAADYMNAQRAHLKQAVMESFERLSKEYELVLVEGAGSPAEINLRQHDIANMGFARTGGVPVCLIGDIDRGGVIAAIAGTQAVIDPEDARTITSFIINRFRGDPALFTDGVTALEKITGWPCRGVVPWLDSALQLPQEDAVVLQSAATEASAAASPITVSVLMLSRIANFDDFDPLKAEPGVNLVFVPPGNSIPVEAHAIIIPGTKSTIADLKFLREQGWHHDIIAASRRGVKILGLCGGYQILGKEIADPDRIEGDDPLTQGLGLLDVATRMQKEKHIGDTTGICMRSGTTLKGYEIHIGSSTGNDTARPFFERSTPVVKHKPSAVDGAISSNGKVEGTYLHGLFNSDAFRHWWLSTLQPGYSSQLDFDETVERNLDSLADGLEESLDVDALFTDAGVVSN